MTFKVGKIMMEWIRIDVIVRSEERPASEEDIEGVTEIFSKAMDAFCSKNNVKDRPLLSVGSVAGQFPSCNVLDLIETDDVTKALNPSLTGVHDDGIMVIFVGDDEMPASQKDLDDIHSHISPLVQGTWLVSHHLIDVTYA